MWWNRCATAVLRRRKVLCKIMTGLVPSVPPRRHRKVGYVREPHFEMVKRVHPILPVLGYQRPALRRFPVGRKVVISLVVSSCDVIRLWFVDDIEGEQIRTLLERVARGLVD